MATHHNIEVEVPPARLSGELKSTLPLFSQINVIQVCFKRPFRHIEAEVLTCNCYKVIMGRNVMRP